MPMKSGSFIFITLIVSLGGFLFGFDAGIISGVMSYAGPQFDLNDWQSGWVVSSPSFSAMLAMLVAGRVSDLVGRKRILLVVAFLYALSAILSAYAVDYNMLWIARMIGGIAFGAALILAPTYIAEISTAKDRGKLVSVQQLNIVLGFFAAFLCNYFLNQLNAQGSTWLDDRTVWRWMLGLEFFPAMLYFFLMFLVPRSPRWLYMHGLREEAERVLNRLHGPALAAEEAHSIVLNIQEKESAKRVHLRELFGKSLRSIVGIGLAIGILQQVTGINAIYFYATRIFKQTGIGTNAAFASGVWLSLTAVVFTVLAILLVDRMGRRPLLNWGMGGIAVSLLLCAFGFYGARYELTAEDLDGMKFLEPKVLDHMVGKVYSSDVEFKNDLKSSLGTKVYGVNEGEILEAATAMNATLILIGTLGFVACFAFSLGPVMWVLLSEIFPNRYRGLAIGSIGFVNSFSSWLVQQIFPWELSTLGSATTFLIFGLIALAGFFLFLRIVPETKGKTLEEIETEFSRG